MLADIMLLMFFCVRLLVKVLDDFNFADEADANFYAKSMITRSII